VWRASVAAALLAATVACGGPGARLPTPRAEWQANARQVAEQLRGDVAAAEIGGTTRRAAARALADTSDLYGLLVAYADLGGCHAMVGAIGAPARVVATFDPVCAHLQRAAALFAVAARGNDAGALVRAGDELGLAQPHLVRALLAIRQAQPGTRGEK
jgi:protein-disulfide isomerase